MAITFPPTDDTTPDDGSVKYTDPDNGREYYWNGYAWELVCEAGGGVDGDFLLKYGDTVDDATENVDYSWNKQLTFESTENINIKTPERVTLQGEQRVEINTNTDTSVYCWPEAVGMANSINSIIEINDSTYAAYYDADKAIIINGGTESEIQIQTSKEILIGADSPGNGNVEIIKVEGENNKGYYSGLIEEDTSLVNKEFVDNKFDFSQYEELS